MARSLSSRRKKAATPPQSKQTPRGGRPPGSKTAEYEPVVYHPPRCPKCGSTDLKPIPGVGPARRALAYAGTTPTGEPFTRIEFPRRQCGKCGQRLVVRAYHNDEKKN